MLSKKLILPSLATLLLFNGHLIAEETTEEKTEASIDGHVSVRSREMDPAKRERMQNLRAQQRDDEESDGKADAQHALRRARNKMTTSGSQFMLAPRHMARPQLTLAAYAFPINCHWLTSIADNNRSLELEDGSHWEVSPSDAYILRNWRREDSLVITPNYSWLSGYDYFITNKSTNSYVKANLYVGPVAFGPYSHWIVDIDYFGGHVFLENQMIWCINPQDSYVLKDWAVNDHVIFGLYDSWFSPYDHILINVNMDDHIRVKQY
ncbi:MAG: hypothetical protein JSS60_04285 [Verrucomicrobia bacterium]|nr:hypothetical protein [Verrucomicrobiota bacterium]